MIERAMLFGVMVVAVCGGVVAQEAEQDETTVQQEEEAVEDALPGLDDLLGIGGDSGSEEVDEDALDTNKAELERELTDEELGEQFVQAIKQMEEAADRMMKGRDGGVVTQRLQEEILVKLDLLIEQSQDQQSGGGQSSSSSDSSSSNQPPQQGGQQSQGGQQDQGSAAAGNGGEGDPEYNEGKSELIEAVGAGWGALPERVRETLLEGLNDVFSSRYKEQTEAYYRRLAEEGEKE